MILTVTLNPLLERRLTYDKVKFSEENRNGISELKAGGKGINASRQLNNLNIDNLAYTFSGGINGKIFKEILSKENIKFTFVRTSAEIREASIIIEKYSESLSTFYQENSLVSKNEADEFKNKLEKMIENCEIVIFSGSSPCKETDSIFPFGIRTANKYDKISICDTYGNHLKDCIEAGPTILHNNVAETENSLQSDLNSEKSKIDYLNYLYSKNIKQAYLTEGSSSFYCSNFDYHFKVSLPQIPVVDPTGSGDSFVAGIAYGIHKNLTFHNSLAIASSLGIENALRYDAANVRSNEIDKWKDQVKIESSGKKMKTLDVTPR